ncbi:MAG: sortase-associated OmpA-like protein PdsO [Gammaproteobacteria bacterium]
MKTILPKSILAISVVLPLSILPPVFANNETDERNAHHVEESLGFGTGAAIGGLIAGPIGIVTGAFIGSLIGQNVSSEKENIKLTNSYNEGKEKYKITTEKIKTLEEESARQSLVLNDAHRTIEKLFSQNHELKNHALNFDVQFRTNSIVIEKQYQEYLKSLANTLITTPTLEIEVAGFADRIGDEDFNMLLSNQRAKQVKEFFIEQGIEEDRITTLAYGETQPLHVDDDLENNFFDRRASIFIIPREISTKNIAEEIINAEKELSVAIK